MFAEILKQNIFLYLQYLLILYILANCVHQPANEYCQLFECNKKKLQKVAERDEGTQKVYNTNESAKPEKSGLLEQSSHS